MKGTQLLVAFCVVIGAYVALTLTGHDASGLVGAAVTLLGILGLGYHVERRTQEQNTALASVQDKAETIERQTNGVLDARIKQRSAEAMRQVLAEHGIVKPDSTDSTTP